MKKRILSIALTLVMLFSAVPATAISASAATSGRTGSGTYCTVKISQTLLSRKGKQYAKVKLKTYDASGLYNTGKKVQVTLKDGKGRYICSWVAKGGDTLKLGDDHSVYRIYVNYYDNPGNNIISQGNNFTNMGGSYKWKVSNASNCSIS